MTFVRFNSGSSMSIDDGWIRIHWRSGRVDQLRVDGVTVDCPAVNVDEMVVHIRTPNGVIQIAKAESGDQFIVATRIDWWFNTAAGDPEDLDVIEDEVKDALARSDFP